MLRILCMQQSNYRRDHLTYFEKNQLTGFLKIERSLQRLQSSLKISSSLLNTLVTGIG